MGKQLVITEKPSVARDISAALGGFSDHGEYLESDDYVVTWAVGHLLELQEPQDYDKALRSWSIKNLPIIPEQFEIKPRDGQKKRLDQIRKLGRRKDVEGIINACDAGREGESIYRRIAEYAKLTSKPERRLWLQSMTAAAILQGFQNLRPGSDLDSLGDAAWLRGVGDWLIGLNATRALTQRLKSRGERGSWSAGRVQTPTLNLLVTRERERLAHDPEPYWEMVANFHNDDQNWEGRYFDKSQKADDLHPHRRPARVFDAEVVKAIVGGVNAAKTGLASETRKKSKQSPPLLFDLTSLQREANRRFSFSAKRTLDAAQRLYEAHKLLTYPRTDSRYLPGDYQQTLTNVLTVLSSDIDFGPLASSVVAAGPQNLQKLLDSSKVSDHHAIIPTGGTVPNNMRSDDEKIYELVVRQFLAALMGPATWVNVERIVVVDLGSHATDAVSEARFRTTARSLLIPGWQAAFDQQVGAGTHLPELVPGSNKASDVSVEVDDIAEEAKETKPAPRFSEAQLLRLMETAGELVDDDDLSDAMRGRGLGTPATRADTIERLVNTTYARRVDGKLAPTAKGMRLMDVLERVDADMLASPQLTGEWEHALLQVQEGEEPRQAVLDRLVASTRTLIGALTGFEHDELYAEEESLGACPNCADGQIGENAWGYPCSNNTGKDAPCNFMIWKDRMGRFIDRRLVRRLVEERKLGPISGFVDRRGRTMEGTLSLVKDEEKGRWVLETDFGNNPTGEDVEEVVIGELFDCPEYEGHKIVETNLRYVTSKVLKGEARSGPVLPKVVCSREMSVEEAAAFFSEAGKTEILDNFISKRGRPFRGALFRKKTGRHGFEFPPREKKATSKTTAKKKKKKSTRKTKAKAKSTRKTTSKAKTTRKTTRKSTSKAKSKTTSKAKSTRKSTAKKSTRKSTRKSTASEAATPAD